jgi:hypothetical protein
LKAYRGQERCAARNRPGFTLRISLDPLWSLDTSTLRLVHLLAARADLVHEWSAKLSYLKTMPEMKARHKPEQLPRRRNLRQFRHEFAQLAWAAERKGGG